MLVDIPMPSLGADMNKGKLMKWLVSPGEEVKKGEGLAVIETAKATFEIENFHSGILKKIIAQEGEEVKVGASIAVLDQTELEENMENESSGIDVPLTGAREVISNLMTKSKHEIPHYYLKQKMKLGTLMNWLEAKNKELSPDERILVPVVFFKATIMALEEFGELNATFSNNLIHRSKTIDLSVALSSNEKTLIAPSIKKAEELSLKELQEKVLDLDERARAGKLKKSELFSGTFTVTNLGELGVDEVYGVIFPPQVGLLGIGRPHEENSTMVCDFTLSADHRVTDGLYGAKFLRKIDYLLHHPELIERIV